LVRRHSSSTNNHPQQQVQNSALLGINQQLVGADQQLQQCLMVDVPIGARTLL
jgi:hypothetical protein